MSSLNTLQKKIDRAFQSLKFEGKPDNLYEPVRYTLKAGGKRIRPLLVLCGNDMFGGDPDKALPVAIGIELFHNFTLFHDDIMDRASLRRGTETVFKKWNVNVAILSGDTLFALAYESILKAEEKFLPDLLPLFTLTAKQVCEGQQYDMNFETTDQVTIPEYLEMIRLKTSVLLACSLESGAILAGAKIEDGGKLYRVGECLGMAFQLQDDLLDLYGSEEKTGKNKGSDIVQNKKTFLYLAAREHSASRDRSDLVKYFHNSSMDPADKIKKVKEIYDRNSIREITTALIGEYFEKAFEWLDKIAIDVKRKKNLKELGDLLIRRDY